MPTDPNHAHADVAHPKTVMEAGWTYGCHTDKVGPGPRGCTRKAWVQDGWRTIRRGEIVTREPIMVEVETKWNSVACGHLMSAGQQSDPACAGCESR